MESDGGEFPDWELLHNAGESDSLISSDSMKGFEGIEDDSEGMIQTDYFSIDSPIVKFVPEDVTTEEGFCPIGLVSENPSSGEEQGESSSASDNDRPGDIVYSFSCAIPELEMAEDAKIQAGFEGELLTDPGQVGSVAVETRGIEEGSLADIGDTKISQYVDSTVNPGLGTFLSNAGCSESNDGKYGESETGILEAAKTPIDFERIEKIVSDGEDLGIGSDVYSEEDSCEEQIAAVEEAKGKEEKDQRTVVWWKLPVEFLKYCAFRANPVWTFSMAAAVMGFVILGRRLYKTRKSRSLQLKVTMNDKKVSQFMNRSARLNEALSVNRVPVVRPSLPAAGWASPWLVMNFR